MRYAAKTDINQKPMVTQIRRAGFHVHPTHRLGDGFPDLVVTGYSMKLRTVAALLVEVKRDGEGLTEAEKEFHEGYPLDGPLIIARHAEDVLRWFGRIEEAPAYPPFVAEESYP